FIILFGLLSIESIDEYEKAKKHNKMKKIFYIRKNIIESIDEYEKAKKHNKMKKIFYIRKNIRFISYILFNLFFL
ncbi:hypothetical protein DXA62_17220, partial [Coprobacillus sp. OF03-2AA]